MSDFDLTSPLVENPCTVVDVSAHEDCPPTLSCRCKSRSGFELLAALRQPPEHVCVQVVFWPIRANISHIYLDTFGLGLRIDPQFFLTLIDTLGGLQRPESTDVVVETRPLRPSHVVIGRAVATFVRQYPLDKPFAAPIILIAGEIYPDPKLTSEGLSDTRCIANQRLNKSPPFTYPKPPVASASGYQRVEHKSQRI